MIYPSPPPEEIPACAEGEMPTPLAKLPVGQHRRISGLGVAMPFELWNWEADLETPPGALGQWRDFVVVAERSRRFAPRPGRLCDDATSAGAGRSTVARAGAPLAVSDFLCRGARVRGAR